MTLFPGVKRPGREAIHVPVSSTGMRISGITLHSVHSPLMVCAGTDSLLRLSQPQKLPLEEQTLESLPRNKQEQRTASCVDGYQCSGHDCHIQLNLLDNYTVM